MQVSTISVYGIDIQKNCEKTRNAEDGSVGSSFEKLGTTSPVNLQQTYAFINEWKEFCHKQILANNIDFIA